MEGFVTHHVRRTHEFVLGAEIDSVFHLFTPAGERLWADGWRPVFLYPPTGDTREGMVFTTDHDHEHTIWALVELNPEHHRVRYVRVTPGSRFGFVEVACMEESADRTLVTVTYEITALTAAGNDYVASFGESEYREMILSWQQDIEAFLASSRT
ncbi:MAG: SRPBCC family protein [Candidatus Schekmanbacteria bacterium]|nr:SRPBCC family protein [Candidatus Schekmanbacteria bacterium]